MFTLWSAGSNAYGQLSNGTLDDSHTFKKCSFLGHPPGTLPPNTCQVLDIVAGANHTLILLETRDEHGTNTREIWASGDGSAGQLGTAYRQLVENGLANYQAKFISASWETTYIVLACGGKGDILISMGADDFGDLGIGGKDSKKSYVKGTLHAVEFGHLMLDGSPLKSAHITVQSISSGQRHVVVQLRAVWTSSPARTCWVGWGTARHGQLGSVLGSGGRPVPYISKPALLHIGDSSDLVLYGALGSQHTAFLHASGKVSGLGSNRKGQLQGLESVKAVTHLGCTWNGTYVVINEGGDKGNSRILATGSSSHGQLGRELISNSVVTECPTLALVDFLVPTGSHISTLACGTEHVLVLLASGVEPGLSHQVWGWGWNEHGTLGNSSTEDVFTPEKIWPPASLQSMDAESLEAVGIWAGSGTSWIATNSTVFQSSLSSPRSS